MDGVRKLVDEGDGGGCHVVLHCDWMEQTAAVMTVQWGVGLHASTPPAALRHLMHWI